MDAKAFKKIIIDKLAETLKPKHFKKNGQIFSRSTNDLTHFIGFQSSQDSTATVLKATLNIKIHSSLVYSLQDTSQPAISTFHYLKRIGYFLDNPHDKWWTVKDEKESLEVAREIVELISNKVLPELESLTTTDDLARLWRQGESPGLTDYTRKEYLQLLDSSANKNEK